MASQAQRGDRYGPREKLGAFSRIVRSVTFMSQEQKIAFDNSVKAIRGRSGIYHRAGRPLLMKSPKALPSKVWQSCRTFPTRDGGNENVRRSER